MRRTNIEEQIIFRHHPIVIIAVLLLTIAQSAAANPGEDWLSGQQAFQEGDYGSALHHFQTARNAGLEGPAVQYNIAVCHFKLNEFEQAGQEFQQIADQYPKLRGLAEYNLGLVARRLGDTRSARQHLLNGYRLSPGDEKLRILASRMLRELEPDVATASRWTGAAGLRIGNDDNVALRDELGLPAGVTPQSPMADVFGSIQGPWNGRSGFRLNGTGYLIRYFDADEFDQSDFRGRVFYDWRPNDWRIQIGVHASVGTLGGDAFDQKAGANARVIRYLRGNASVELHYLYDEVSDRDSIFAGIAGSRQQLDARYRWYSDGHRLVLRYWTETNDRDDPGVSPKRNRLGLDYRYQPEMGWGYEAGVDFRNSDYKDLAIPREEDLLTIRSGLTHMLPANWLVTLEYRYSENDSSDPEFSYNRNQISVGVLKIF